MLPSASDLREELTQGPRLRFECCQTICLCFANERVVLRGALINFK